MYCIVGIIIITFIVHIPLVLFTIIDLFFHCTCHNSFWNSLLHEECSAALELGLKVGSIIKLPTSLSGALL